MRQILHFFLLLAVALRITAAQQTINVGTNPNDGTGDSLRSAFTKVNANFTNLYSTALFTNSALSWSALNGTPTTLSGYGITDAITAATVTNYYATKASPTFTGTVTIPSGASIAGYLTTATAASTYAPLSGPVFTGSLTLPSWSTAGRPASPVAGMIGWNTDLLRFDHYTGGAGWKNFVRLDGDTMTGALTATSFSGAGTGLTGTASGLSIGGNAATATLATNATTATTATSATSATTATTATNIIGGSAGSLPYQTGSGATTTLGIGSANTVLTSSGTAPQWSSSLSSIAGLGLTSAATVNWNSDTYVLRDAANIVAQRNSTTAQALRVYNTYTDASNFERAVMDWTTTANTLTIGTQKAGTGAIRAINIVTGSGTALGFTTANVANFGSDVSLNQANYYGWSSRSQLSAPADGVILLSNFNLNGFTRLDFGGTTASFPAISRSTTTLQARLADDSGFAAVQSLYDRFGSGSPEGVVTAPVGAIYHRTDGGASTSLYVKESGAGNTGWVAK